MLIPLQVNQAFFYEYDQVLAHIATLQFSSNLHSIIRLALCARCNRQVLYIPVAQAGHPETNRLKQKFHHSTHRELNGRWYQLKQRLQALPRLAPNRQ